MAVNLHARPLQPPRDVLRPLYHLHEELLHIVKLRGHALPVLAQELQVFLQMPRLRQP